MFRSFHETDHAGFTVTSEIQTDGLLGLIQQQQNRLLLLQILPLHQQTIRNCEFIT